MFVFLELSGIEEPFGNNSYKPKWVVIMLLAWTINPKWENPKILTPRQSWEIRQLWRALVSLKNLYTNIVFLIAVSVEKMVIHLRRKAFWGIHRSDASRKSRGSLILQQSVMICGEDENFEHLINFQTSDLISLPANALRE